MGRETGSAASWPAILASLRGFVDFDGCIVLRRCGGSGGQEVLHLEGGAPGVPIFLPATTPLDAVPSATAAPASPTGRIMDIAIPAEGGVTYVIMLVRGPARRPFDAEARDVVGRLAPMLGVLGRWSEQLRTAEAAACGARQLRAALLDVIDRFGAGLWLVDERLRVLLASPRASASCAFTVRGGQLMPAAGAQDERPLAEAVAAVLQGGSGGVPPLRGLRLGTGLKPVRVLVTALDTGGGTVGGDRIAAIVQPPGDLPEHEEGVIQALFGLTRVEASIARLLCEGMPPNEAAERLRIKPNTLRGYLKGIFLKLEVHRQADLVRLIGATAGLLRRAPLRPVGGGAGVMGAALTAGGADVREA
jgi:DNA-binding CsgD family transcriptional regulator